MHHTYTLKNNGKNTPNLISASQARVVRVENPRSLELDGLTLQLPDAEPDLPVGEEVRVWRDRRFRCESLDSNADKKNLQVQTGLKYVLATQALLRGVHSPKMLRAHVASLRAERGRCDVQVKKLLKSKKPADKQKVEEAISTTVCIDEAITLVSRHLIARLSRQSISGGAAYAYGPGEGVHYDIRTPGRDHFQLVMPLVRGRLVRQMGDVLCKPSCKFWGLRITDDPARISCWACLKRMMWLLE